MKYAVKLGEVQLVSDRPISDSDRKRIQIAMANRQSETVDVDYKHGNLVLLVRLDDYS
jgi:hypothetical protein